MKWGLFHQSTYPALWRDSQVELNKVNIRITLGNVHGIPFYYIFNIVTAQLGHVQQQLETRRSSFKVSNTIYTDFSREQNV